MPKEMGRTTYYSIGRDAKSGVFVQRSAGGVHMKIMGQRAFKHALDAADAKLRQLAGSDRAKDALGCKKPKT